MKKTSQTLNGKDLTSRSRDQWKSSVSINLHIDINLVIFSVGFFCQESGLLQLVLQSLHSLFIWQRTVLKDFSHTEKVGNIQVGKLCLVLYYFSWNIVNNTNLGETARAEPGQNSARWRVLPGFPQFSEQHLERQTPHHHWLGVSQATERIKISTGSRPGLASIICMNVLSERKWLVGGGETVRDHLTPCQSWMISAGRGELQHF